MLAALKMAQPLRPCHSLHVRPPVRAWWTPSPYAVSYPNFIAVIAAITTAGAASTDSVSSTVVSPVGTTVNRPAACAGRVVPTDKSAVQTQAAIALTAVS